MSIHSILLAAAMLGTPAQEDVSGGPWPQYYGPPVPEMIAQINAGYTAELKALHEDGLAIRQADGGTLSPSHRAELQTRLDRINASYRRIIGRYGTVDALGRRH